MKKHLLVSLGAAILFVLGLAHVNASEKDPPSAEVLFNGRDLSGWIPMHGGEWSVEDGAIVGRNGVNWTTNPEKSGSWLRSVKEYSDFLFECEYTISKNGNSGIFLRSAIEKNPAFSGHELQIVDDFGRVPQVYTTGALYDVVAAAKNMSKPAGEWNQVKIMARGARIRIWLNGAPVVDYTSSRRTRGYLGLQNHDDATVVRFRHLRIRENLSAATSLP